MISGIQNYSIGVKNGVTQGMVNTAKTVNYHHTSPAAPAFTGKVSGWSKFLDKYFPLKMNSETREIINHFPERQRKTIEWMDRLGGWAKGEAAGIGITAIGTGLVAPWPIAYNPIINHQLKKEHATPEEIEEKHNTQKYSAWRQPVSAVLAVIFQLGVQKPIERMLQLMTNNDKTIFNGTIFNQSFLNNEDYLTRVVKKELGAKDKAAIKKEKDARLNKQIENVINAIKEIKPEDEQIKVGKNIVPTNALAEAFNNEIDDYIDFAQSLKKPETGEHSIAFYAGRAKDLVDNKVELKEVLSPDRLDAEVKAYTNKNSKLRRSEAIRAYISELRKGYEKDNRSAMVRIMDHILGKTDVTIESACARNLERIDKVENICGGPGKFDMTKYYDFLENSNHIIDMKITEFKDLKVPEENWDKIKPNELKARIDKLIETCHYDYEASINSVKLSDLFKDLKSEDKGVFFANNETLVPKIYKDLVKKGYREVVSNQYKIFSQITKASIATFIMLPITCTALNWVYPRFMDLFFPNLSGKKKTPAPDKKGGVV